MAFVDINCQECQKPLRIQSYFVEKQGRKHCSMKCYAASMRGKPSSAKGIHRSEESRARMSTAQKDRVAGGDYVHPMLGRHHSDQTRKKMAASAKIRDHVAVPPVMVGKEHPNWKGGITSLDRRERIKFRQLLHAKILARDNYTCQICDQYSGNLSVDHIKSWADYPESRFEEENCRTLCMACHYYVTFKRKLPKGVIWGHNLNRRMTS